MKTAKWIVIYRKRLNNWSTLKWSERYDLLNDMENDLAYRQNRPCCEIYGMPPGKHVGIFGEYNHAKPGILFIDKELFKNSSARHVVDAVIHEGRHAYQYDCIQNPQKHPEAQKHINAWRNNLLPGNYIPQPVDPISYQNQPVEKDAIRYAKLFVRLLKI